VSESASSSVTIPVGRKLPWASGRVGCPCPGRRSARRQAYGGPAGPARECLTVPIARNKANFPRVGRNGRGPARSPMPVPLGQSVRNKANCSRATRRASTVWKKSYVELDAQKASVKQSRFPHGQPWGEGRQGGPCRRWDPSCETKPIGGPLGVQTKPMTTRGRPVASNKPNWQWPAVQTKPIPGKGMETNASWRHYERGAERAKQSQLPQSGVQGKYLVEKGVITNSTRKGPWQNKANSRTDGSGRGAASRQGGPCRRWDPSCETKPICLASTETGTGRQGRKRGRCWGQACKTKPISGVRPARWIWNRQLRAQRGNPPP
jgi:hypothetical protein